MDRRGRALGVVGAPSVVVAVFGWSVTADASGFAAAKFGGEHGNPTESNPTALYYNPAGIAFSEGTHVYGDLSIALRHATWTHAQSKYDVPEPPGAEGANYGKGTLTNVFAGPAFGATTKLGDLALGIGLFVPFGGRAKWDQNDKFANSTTYPLAVDGVQRWHSIEGAITFLYLTAGAAYKLGPFSIGVSGNLIFSSIRSLQAKTLATGNNDVDQEVRSDLDVSGKQGSFAVGLMWEAVEKKLWIGASYQAAPGIGEMKMKGTLTNSAAAGVAVDRVDFHQQMPDIVRFGARFRPVPDLELRLFGDFTRWSRMVTQCASLEDRSCDLKQDGSPATGSGTVINLYRAWRDTIGIRAGASKWLSPEVELFAGLGFESYAVPDNTLDPQLPDANTISISAGGRFEVADKLWIGAGYMHIQYLDRDNTGKSILDDPKVHPTTRRVDGGGKYTQWIGVLNVNVEKQF
jgi:long-chain fatty acid transport protein